MVCGGTSGCQSSPHRHVAGGDGSCPGADSGDRCIPRLGNYAETVQGIQVGAFFNGSEVLRGVQIGLFNYAGNNSWPFKVLPGINMHFSFGD